MPTMRVLNDVFDLSIRAADWRQGLWESSGDIIDRHKDRPVARVYGRGRSAASAEKEVEREAERWVEHRSVSS